MAAGATSAAPSLWPRSEKLDLDQLQLGLEDEEQAAAESEAAKDAAEPSERRRHTQPANRNRNRGALPAHLPRYEVVIDIASKECPCCGGALHVIGEDRSETPKRPEALALRRELAKRDPGPCRPDVTGQLNQVAALFAVQEPRSDHG